MKIHLDPTKKHDFIWLLDCKNGNPNGDPDANNMPRMDLQTGHGLITDACLKRKIRNFITLTSDQPIFVAEGSILNEAIAKAAKMTGSENQPRLSDPKDVNLARDWMCKNFYDIRMFGAVLSTGKNAGQVRGAMQLTFAESLDPILPMHLSVTRCAATEEQKGKDNKTIGRKNIIPYGLFQAQGFFSPYLAEQTGVTSADLALFWDAVLKGFELDRSAARGLMATQGVWIFTHESPLGNYPTHKLFDCVSVQKREGVIDPRHFNDYTVSVEGLPKTVTLTQL